jgi:Flp pilus assembly protein TadG
MQVLYAVLLPVILVLCGLVVDVGMLELTRVRMQSAADAAALSAEIEAESGTGNWVSRGQADAALNGFVNGSNNTTVNVSQIPNIGAYAGRYDALQVVITQKVSTIFMGTFSGGKVNVSTTAVSLLTPCLYVLGATLPNEAINQNVIVYTGALKGSSCPMNVNGSINVSGSYVPEASNVSGPSGSSIITGYVYPPTNFNAPTVTDPLYDETAPSFSGTCSHTSYSITSGSTTLTPGNYCKGLTISNANVTFSPGLYIITGGATWTNATVTGTGVTIYFTTGGGASYGQFKVSNSTVTLSAPTASSNGALAAILFFADRNWSATASQDFQCLTSTFQGDGIWYLKSAGLEVYNCSTFTGNNYLGIVANNVFTAGSNMILLNNYTYLLAGNPFRNYSPLVQ